MQLRGLRIKKFSAGIEKDRVEFFQQNRLICLKFVTGSPLLRLALLILAPAVASAQIGLSPYLLRFEHTTSESHLCVLVQKTGFFHLESDSGDSTKVSEGSLSPDRLQQVRRDLQDNRLETLSQEQIEEPLIRRHEFLQVNISRDDHWQELTFFSAESQEPYREVLQPLIRWLNDLHKLPHKELSEDAGKNNCLAPGKIALKKRDETVPQGSAKGRENPASMPSTGPPESKPDPVSALLRLSSLSVKSDGVRQSCVLVIANGFYRAEERDQKVAGKRVETKITGGKFAPEETSQLQQLLDDPGIARIRHRKTSRLVLPMSGEMLNLQIYKSSEVQDVVLSSTFNHRDVPFFYSGDGDISSAQPLLKFVTEHVWTAGSGRLDPSLRNDCQSAP